MGSAGKGLAARRRVASATVSGGCQILPAVDRGSSLIWRIGRMTNAGRHGSSEKRTEAMTRVAHD
jgi:hypothetical protein